MLFALKPARRKMLLLPLIAATYFMVSGGPYGIEDILGGAGFGRAIAILLVLPILWSLPTALMIGELASAIPAEGGFYVWVRRALGPFWGYQEGWLSLSASIFDMAIYPAIFVLYLGRFNPALTAGWFGYAWSIAVVAVCCIWNLRGAPAVGDGSVGLFVLLLAPFAVFVVLGVWRGLTLHPVVQWGNAGSGAALSTAVMVAMWNYMGWDNASTVAQEVKDPQRNYPRAMIAAAALVAVTYILPLLAMALSGLSVASFSTGDWMTAAISIGGPLLGYAVVAGGIICGLGMFNALAMSYTRLPMAMAEDGMLPLVLARRNQRGVPWVSVLLCGLAWALALKLPFERLISIDLILYGSSLLLEFVALIVLRVREPELPRPFKAGNLVFACSLAVGPAALIAFALYASRNEKLMGSISALLFAICVALLGPVLYWLTALPLARRRLATAPAAD
jgi:amino acid transporter